MTDADRWVRLPQGSLLVPPPYCPACGWAWHTLGPWRPRQKAMFCGCTIARSHTLWVCACGALVAEGCTDVAQWGSYSIPAGLPEDARWTC